ncbi:MAG TPA: phosphoribosyltransferase family protein [Catalimonadaceae bacterium]|nr:phosphoribosyltransferase family protein [Catalimonadaceae bacterium]
MEEKKILDQPSIEVIIMRMSHQVHEQFFEFEELVIVGIESQGLELANRLNQHLMEMKAFKTEVIGLSLDKHQSSRPDFRFSPPLQNLNGKPVLLVDDVLNSGRTLTYCLSPLVEFQIPRLLVAVLVERIYRKFPVSASITGIPLSTTVEEKVVVRLSGDETEGIYLS